MPHVEPEHVGAAWLFWELAKLVPPALRKLLKKKPAAAPAPKVVSHSAIVEAEFRGEIHEFKRQVLEELRVQRERYHGLRSMVATLIGINEERRAARKEGREFDTGAYEIDLREMSRRLDAIPDVQLPQLSPPEPRPPLALPPGRDDEGGQE